MKRFHFAMLVLLGLLPAITRAASDADVNYLKAKEVVIKEDEITITVTEAKTQITLIRDGYDPAYKGDNWHGMPINVVQVISNKATFTIKRPAAAAPEKSMAKAWQDTLRIAKDLQDGQEISRIGFYAPDIVIKGNMIDSITGPGYLYPK